MNEGQRVGSSICEGCAGAGSESSKGGRVTGIGVSARVFVAADCRSEAFMLASAALSDGDAISHPFACGDIRGCEASTVAMLPSTNIVGSASGLGTQVRVGDVTG